MRATSPCLLDAIAVSAAMRASAADCRSPAAPCCDVPLLGTRLDELQREELDGRADAARRAALVAGGIGGREPADGVRVVQRQAEPARLPDERVDARRLGEHELDDEVGARLRRREAVADAALRRARRERGDDGQRDGDGGVGRRGHDAAERHLADAHDVVVGRRCGGVVDELERDAERLPGGGEHVVDVGVDSRGGLGRALDRVGGPREDVGGAAREQPVDRDGELGGERGARMLWLGDTMATLATYADAIADDRAVGVGLSLDSIRGDAAQIAIDLRAASEVYRASGDALIAYAEDLEVAIRGIGETYAVLTELAALQSVVDHEVWEAGLTANLLESMDPEAQWNVAVPPTPIVPFSLAGIGADGGYRTMLVSDARPMLAERLVQLGSYAIWLTAQTHLELVDYDIHFDHWESGYSLCIDAIEVSVNGVLDDQDSKDYQQFVELQELLSDAGVAADGASLIPYLGPFAAAGGTGLSALETLTALVQLGYSATNSVDTVDGQTLDDLLDVAEAAVGLVPFMGTLLKLPKDGKDAVGLAMVELDRAIATIRLVD